jgi:hypothetical protein
MADWVNHVRVATTGNLAALTGLLTIDGVTLAASDRVLVKDQTTAKDNGLYSAAAGAWSRTADTMVPELAVRVSEGTANAHTEWYLATQGTITTGTTALVFAPLSASGVYLLDLVATKSVTLSGLGAVIDGVTVTAGMVILAVAQVTGLGAADPVNNGPWVAAAGAWTRPTSYNADAQVVVGQQFYPTSGTSLARATYKLKSGAAIAGAKFYVPTVVEINLEAAPWNFIADGVTPEDTKLAALWAFCQACVAAGSAVQVLLPSSGFIAHTNTQPLLQTVSIRGVGPASGFRLVGTTNPPIPKHSFVAQGLLGAGGNLSSNYRDFQVQNQTDSWHFNSSAAGGVPYWQAGFNYNTVATPVGTLVKPLRASNRVLQLTSTRGTSGSFTPLGELRSVNWASKIIGTENAAHATIFKVTTAGYLGTAQFAFSTDGGNNWGAAQASVADSLIGGDQNRFTGAVPTNAGGTTTLSTLGADFGVLIMQMNWPLAATTSTTASYTQPAVGAAVAIQVTSTATIAGTGFVTIAGGGLYSVTVTDSTHLSATLIVSFAAGTIGSGASCTSVWPPAPRVEIIGTPTANDYMVDVWVTVTGVLGTGGMQYYIRNGTPGSLGIDLWVYTTGGITGPNTPSGGLGHTDVALAGMTLRFHSGVYHRQSDPFSYQTPAFGWSLEPGSTVTDGGNVWTVLEGGDCIRLNGGSFAVFENVYTNGGKCGFVLSQAENVLITGNYFCNGYSLAAVWIPVDSRTLGDGGQIANQIEVSGAASFYGDGFGILDDGGLTHQIGGALNFQLCPEGWCQIAGLYGGKICADYVETTGGRLRNSSYCSRNGSVQGVLSMDLSTGYAGSIAGNYFLDCYGAAFSSHGVLGGGAVACFGNLLSCFVHGDAQHFGGGAVTDQQPGVGELFDLRNGWLICGKRLEIKPQQQLAVAAGNLDNWTPAGSTTIPRSDIALTGAAGPIVMTGIAAFATHAFANGTKYRIRNYTGQWVTLANNNAGSTSGQRIYTQSGEDQYIPPGIFSSFEVEYVNYVTPGWYVTAATSSDQFGTATLAAGVTAAIPAAIKSTSRIFITQKAPSGTSLTTEYAALTANRTNGVPGSFKITALLAAGTINTADASTVEWLVKNP